MDPNWSSLPDRLSPMVADRATKQLSIERSLAHRWDAGHAHDNDTHRTRVVLNFPAKGKSGASRRQAGYNAGGAQPSTPSEVVMPPGTKLPSNKY